MILWIQSSLLLFLYSVDLYLQSQADFCVSFYGALIPSCFRVVQIYGLYGWWCNLELFCVKYLCNGDCSVYLRLKNVWSLKNMIVFFFNCSNKAASTDPVCFFQFSGRYFSVAAAWLLCVRMNNVCVETSTRVSMVNKDLCNTKMCYFTGVNIIPAFQWKSPEVPGFWSNS